MLHINFWCTKFFAQDVLHITRILVMEFKIITVFYDLTDNSQ